MNWQFRAIAIDFDGTLASNERPSGEALAAIEEARANGLRAILVTGRILAELYDVFPTVDDHFDALVVENGAAFSRNGSVRLMTAPVPFELDEALVAQAVLFRRGQVLLASHARYEDTIQQEIRRLGLECQAIRNRSELMILPPAVSKGFGLTRALHSLGISPHSTLAFGDAENDHSLLAVCEIGVAVGNAVEGLKRHADVVLDAPNGTGIATLLRESVLSNIVPLRPRRWKIDLGDFRDGERATLPASQTNILVAGRSKSGKSYLGGTLAEDLIELGYSVCLLDPEGDHSPLADLQGVQRIKLDHTSASLDAICSVIQEHFGSVVVDMSSLARTDHSALFEKVLQRLQRNRAMAGLPHWVIVDEAHHALRPSATMTAALAQGDKGFCLITYQPQILGGVLHDAIDTVLAVPGGTRLAGVDPLEELNKLFGRDVVPVGDSNVRNQAWMLDMSNEESMRLINLRDRVTRHVRHRHKYADAPLPDEARFNFSDVDGQTVAVAHNVRTFRRLLLESDDTVLEGHASRGDFSHWIADVLQDVFLAHEVANSESRVEQGTDLDSLRKQIVVAIDRRYSL